MGDEEPYQEGKRAGAHPLLVVFAVILGLWVMIALFVPTGKHKQATGPAIEHFEEDPDASPVMFKVHATLPDVHAVSIVVPPQSTESQVVGLLRRFYQARLDDTLTSLLPPTSPGDQLGNHAVAEILIFSDAKFAEPEVIRTLSRGAHAPGDLYPQAVTFEDAMEAVRGHYRVDLNDNPPNRDIGSLGYADASGVHSKHYRRVF